MCDAALVIGMDVPAATLLAGPSPLVPFLLLAALLCLAMYLEEEDD